MSIRCGFFNSIGNDRRYDAEDMSKLFDGVISDGVFATKNEVFKIQAITDSMNIEVLSGKAWFNGKYFEIEKNTTVEKTLEAASTLPRYDAVYIQIDNTQSEGGRIGSIEVLAGSAAENPKKPLVTSTETQTKIVIGYVQVQANATNLNNAIITSNVGVKNANPPEEPNACPYSETTLDPRRTIYAYEGESSEDPSLMEYTVLYKEREEASTGYFSFSTDEFPAGYNLNNIFVLSAMLHYPSSGSGWHITDDVGLSVGGRGIYINKPSWTQGSVEYDKCKIIITKIEVEGESQNE